MLNNDMDISSLVVYMKKVEDKKKKQIEKEERHSKKFRYFKQGEGKQNSGRDSR